MGIWPILIVGFGALISLIGLSGWLAYARSKSTNAGISEFYRSEHDSQKALTQIRSDIDLSAILRDFLLDAKLSARAAKAGMTELRMSTENQLRPLEDLIPSSQSEHLTRLRRQATSCWLSLEPVFTSGAKERARLGFSFLETEILPRCRAALRVVTGIERLSEEAFQRGRKEIDGRNADRSFYLANMAGITLLTACTVSGISVFRMHSLERSADVQHRQVQAAEADLRRLSQQLVRAQEEERRSLSRDLHDQVGQVLTALRMSLGNVENAVPANIPAIADELDLAKRLAAQAMRSTRELAMDLRPTMLKYSQASKVNIAPAASGNSITLSIRDDGRGLDPSGSAGNGLGLLGMRERIAELGGNLTIDSNVNEGTRIQADLPLTQM